MYLFAAQSLGILGMAANIVGFQFKSKKNILLCQFIGSLLFAANMFMLKAVTGGIMNILGIARALVYMKKEKIKIPIVIVNVAFILTYLTFYVLVFALFGVEASLRNLIFEFFPIIAMSSMTLAFSANSAKTIRLAGFVNSPCWLVYNCVNFAIGGILCEAFGLVSIISSLIRIDIVGARRKKEEKESA